MALIVADCVMETTTTVGVGPLALAGPLVGFRPFFQVCAVGDTVLYGIAAINGNGQRTGEFETGLGTYSADNQLTRTTVISSSNGNAAVNFGVGTKAVYITVPGPRQVLQDAAGKVQVSGQLVVRNSTGEVLAEDSRAVAVGIGGRVLMRARDDGGSYHDFGRIAASLTDGTPGAHAGDVVISAAAYGALVERLRLYAGGGAALVGAFAASGQISAPSGYIRGVAGTYTLRVGDVASVSDVMRFAVLAGAGAGVLIDAADAAESGPAPISLAGSTATLVGGGVAATMSATGLSIAAPVRPVGVLSSDLIRADLAGAGTAFVISGGGANLQISTGIGSGIRFWNSGSAAMNFRDSSNSTTVLGITDSGATMTNATLTGTLNLGDFTTGTEPAWAPGLVYFNTTLGKMKVGGAAGWETVTST
ncbi:MAG: hypothetical protein KF796_19400 [Ramlibacter sp.]|nr:hypothetical protein [Ramlibacter sp.]